MSNKKNMKSYRIGDYARYMGVTPDFLKHYEQYGLLTPSVTESGYRYYPFNQSSRLLACMDLRSYGFPLREMHSMLEESSLNAYCEKLDARVKQLKEQIAFEQAIVATQNRLQCWMNLMRDKTEDWYIVQSEPFLFLPHSNLYTFLKDARIYELLDHWTPWMPIVKSCLSIRPDTPPDPSISEEETDSPYCWGLAVPEQFAIEHHLPINDVVRRQAAGKQFVYCFKDFSLSPSEDFHIALHHTFLEKLASLNLKPTSDIYAVILYKSHQDGRMLFHGFVTAAIDQ